MSVTRADGLVQTRIYDGNGLTVRSTAPDGSTVSSLYDVEGRPIQVRYGDHPSTTLGYSPAGRPTAYLPPVVALDSGYERGSAFLDSIVERCAITITDLKVLELLP